MTYTVERAGHADPALSPGRVLLVRGSLGQAPSLHHLRSRDVAKIFLPGTDLDELLESDTLLLNGKVVDADVRVGKGSDTLALRLVGVPTPKGYCFFLTNLAPCIGPLQVGEIYRIRWEVEMSFKLDKSSYRLDAGKGERTCSIKALLHASIISSVLTALIVHRHTLETRPQKEGAAHSLPPIDSMLVSKCLIQWAYSFARAFELDGDAADREWKRLAENLTRAAKDPNWRRPPSVLDQMRGWKKQRHRKANRAMASAK